MYRGENNRTRSPLLGSPSYLVLLNTSKYFNWTKRVTSQCHLNVPSLTLSPFHCLGEPT